MAYPRGSRLDGACNYGTKGLGPKDGRPCARGRSDCRPTEPSAGLSAAAAAGAQHEIAGLSGPFKYSLVQPIADEGPQMYRARLAGAGQLITPILSTAASERFVIERAKNEIRFAGGFGSDTIALSDSARLRKSTGNKLDFSSDDRNLTVALDTGHIDSDSGDAVSWDPSQVAVEDVRLRTGNYGQSTVRGSGRGVSVTLSAGSYSHNNLAATGGKNTFAVTASDYSENTVTGAGGRSTVNLTATHYSHNNVTGGSGSNTIAVDTGNYSENTLSGGAGTNKFTVRSGSYAQNTITGGSGSNIVTIHASQYGENTFSSTRGKNVVTVHNSQYTQTNLSGGSNRNDFTIDSSDDQYSETRVNGGTGKNTYTVRNHGNQAYSMVTIDHATRKDVLNLKDVDFASGATLTAKDTDGDTKFDSLEIGTSTGQAVMIKNYFDNSSSAQSGASLKAGTGYIAQVNFHDRRKLALADVSGRIDAWA